VFTTSYLLEALAQDRNELDFGMHILPRAISHDQVFAYPFYGYWRDVGTIQAYWEANMDLLREGSGISPQDWGIRPNVAAEGRPMDRPPARFLAGCTVRSSMISAGCVIEGTVINSVLSPGVQVRQGAVVRDSVVFEDSVIGRNAVLDLVICDKRVRIGDETVVGHGENREIPNRLYPKHLYTGITLVGKQAEVPARMKIGRNCIVNSNRQEADFPASGQLADGEAL
jgi:glucose-1-phosphate adenylyltransferase